MTHIEYRTKKDEVISKFSRGFAEANYLIDPQFHAIVEALVSGVDPYEIIEQLIENRNKILERYVKVCNEKSNNK